MEEQLNMMRRGRQFKQLMNKKMDGVIREYDVKRVEIEILRCLAVSGERNTAADIHRYLDLNKGQISKTLEHLCTMHYLESMPDKRERRYMHYILSEEAKERWRQQEIAEHGRVVSEWLMTEEDKRKKKRKNKGKQSFFAFYKKDLPSA